MIPPLGDRVNSTGASFSDHQTQSMEDRQAPRLTYNRRALIRHTKIEFLIECMGVLEDRTCTRRRQTAAGRRYFGTVTRQPLILSYSGKVNFPPRSHIFLRNGAGVSKVQLLSHSEVG